MNESLMSTQFNHFHEAFHFFKHLKMVEDVEENSKKARFPKDS